MFKCTGVRGRGQSAGVRGRSLWVQVSETSQSDKYSQSVCTLKPDYLALPPTKWPLNEASQPSSHWSGTSCALSATHWTVSRVLSPQVPPGAAAHLNWSRSSNIQHIEMRRYRCLPGLERWFTAAPAWTRASGITPEDRLENPLWKGTRREEPVSSAWFHTSDEQNISSKDATSPRPRKSSANWLVIYEHIDFFNWVDWMLVSQRSKLSKPFTPTRSRQSRE